MTTTRTATIASTIADRLFDAGSDGRGLSARCRAILDAEATSSYSGPGCEPRCCEGETRWDFADGSSIIASDEGPWDIAAGPDCSCWAGAGHRDECERDGYAAMAEAAS